ncbi:MAG: AbrB/MazE/SpoVT family DNA-binding domain-containing protein [Zoogloeaceae bacterium]|nr:AbrB/MazE/SpoVT family DNA-binding domain-containing protein [Zoogloeaceae bacterium]
MTASAKLFKTGHSQAVRLPKAFRLEGDEVWIRRNEATGEIILTPKPTRQSVEDFFTLLEAEPLPDNFLRERPDAGDAPNDPLADWPA